jgi:5-methylcytosine-specific restriction endonuclease McrA
MATSDNITSTSKKRCTKCGEEYPATTQYFGTDSRVKSGLKAACRKCLRAYRVRHYSEHGSEHADKMQMYRATHKKEKRAYYASRRGKASKRAEGQRRRARKAGSGGSYTLDELESVLKAHTDSKGRLRCAFCGKVIKGDYHIDHWIPLKYGGGNTAGNLRILHPRCNLRKGVKMPSQLDRLL